MSEYKFFSEETKQKMRDKNKEWQKQLRPRVLQGYGAVCVCCGEKRIEFLALDHVKGGGVKQAKEFGKNYHYRDALKRNFPPDYQILCHNCNTAKGHYGFCPHERE